MIDLHLERKLLMHVRLTARNNLNCPKCGNEAMLINDLNYCGGCVKPFDDCTCDPNSHSTKR